MFNSNFSSTCTVSVLHCNRKFWGFWALRPHFFKSNSDPEKAHPYVETRIWAINDENRLLRSAWEHCTAEILGFLSPTPPISFKRQSDPHRALNTHFEPLMMKISCFVRAELIAKRKFRGFWAPTPPIFSKVNQTANRHFLAFKHAFWAIDDENRLLRSWWTRCAAKIMGFGSPRLHFFQKSIEPTKGTSVRGNTHFQPLTMKIGFFVRAERIMRQTFWGSWALTP